MANLFPEIEVFTTKGLLWSLNWITNTPLKFAKKMKVLDLTGFGCEENFEAVLDKLKKDDVEHIGLVSFPFLSNRRNSRLRIEDFEELEYIKRILSRATVDHLILPYSRFLEEMYTICGLVNDKLRSPIHVYLPLIRYSYYKDKSDIFALSQKDETSPKSVDNVPEPLERVGPEGCLTPVEEDHGVENKKTVTVILPDEMLTKLPFDLKTTQCLSLQDFPHVKVKFDGQPSSDPRGNIYSSYYDNTKDVCNDLGITTEHDWPIDPVKPPNPEFTRDGNSICHDSTVGESVTSPNAAFMRTLPNLPDVLKKISPHHDVTVAVLDTGILSCHEKFAGKIVAMKNFVPNEDNDLCYDIDGHGTHCAGIVLKTAPFARLVICKVLNSQGKGHLKWAADAMDWLLHAENGPKKYCPVDIISMSFGGNIFDTDLKRRVSEAGAQGKVVVAAASNDGRKRMINIAFPARFGDVICVGSCNNLGQPSSFSSIGRELDFLVAGENIVAPSSIGIDNYQRMSGTSQATPTVAGIAAIVIFYAETVGGETMRAAVSNVTVVREILRKMASKPGHHDEHMGYGNLDPWRLFKYGPDHFRQVVEEIVGPLPVLQPARRDAETQTEEGSG